MNVQTEPLPEKERSQNQDIRCVPPKTFSSAGTNPVTQTTSGISLRDIQYAPVISYAERLLLEKNRRNELFVRANISLNVPAATPPHERGENCELTSKN